MPVPRINWCAQEPGPAGRLIVLLFVVGNAQGQFTESTTTTLHWHCLDRVTVPG